MAKVKSVHLNSPVTNQDGKATQYSFNLKDLILDAESKTKILRLSEQVRTLLRIQNNLKRAYELLAELRKHYNGELPYSHGSETGYQGMFAHAAALYGACFVKGSDHKRPIDTFDSKLIDSDLHKSFMCYRDKLFGHLDKNHEARSDELIWQFRVEENIITPWLGHLAGSRTSMISIQEIEKWMSHIHSIIESIFQYNNALTRRDL